MNDRIIQSGIGSKMFNDITHVDVHPPATATSIDGERYMHTQFRGSV